MKTLQGHLLVATPELLDPNFVRSVVLMLRHDDEGALGLVLTEPLPATVRDAWEQVSELPCAHEGQLYCGGPCPGPLTAIHTLSDLDEIEVLPHVYASIQAGQVERLMTQKEIPVRFFAGWSGWAPDQLEEEIETGSWQIYPASQDHLFGYDDNLWKTVRLQIGSSAVLDSLNIKHIPADPHAN